MRTNIFVKHYRVQDVSGKVRTFLPFIHSMLKLPRPFFIWTGTKLSSDISYENVGLKRSLRLVPRRYGLLQGENASVNISLSE